MLSNNLKHIFQTIFLCFTVMDIDKKLAQMAAKERYIVLETGVSEAKRKEKIQMEKSANNLFFLSLWWDVCETFAGFPTSSEVCACFGEWL